MKDALKTGDILMMGGKVYVSMEMYKDLQKQLCQVQDVAESFLQRLTSNEVAKEHRNNMKLVRV